MWEQIRAARDGSGADVTPIESAPSKRGLPRPRPWWIGVAAALVIGVALGRMSDAPIPAADEDAALVAEAGAPADEGATPGGDAASEADSDAASAAEMLPYRYATVDLLNRSETFLTMVRSGETAEESAEDVRAWARPLLTRTRLLLGSPAAANPELRELLDDLEIVLVQIAQLPEAESEERGWIDEGMDNSRLLFRLRAANAAGAGTVRM
jgi:ElaB/YqjD/DUF883 family membrane-anchored ribosome-binding protein